MAIEITRKSPRTGKTNTIKVDATEEQYLRYMNGMLIQDAFPDLSPEEREFILTGYTPEDWKEMFGDEN